MKCYFLLLLPLALAVCGCSDTSSSSDNTILSNDSADAEAAILAALDFPDSHTAVNPGVLRPAENGGIYNPEAVVPPQCYTRHEEKYNPCTTCHQSYPYGDRPNTMNDGVLQSSYDFSDIGVHNHWLNLFEDRRDKVAAISDQAVIDYIARDNYSTLIEQLKNDDSWSGPIPAIANLHLGAAAFDEQGFARDGSGWVAFNYKPLPSTFWPTNGSTDDVMMRLPESFRSQSCKGSGPSRDTYIANLAILEAAIKDLHTITLPPVDEKAFCTDLNGDGRLGVVSSIQRPAFYVGNASTVPVSKMLYPEGIEFLHSVRYIGIERDGGIALPARMKELRYMRKHTFFDTPRLANFYDNERQEKNDGLLPNYISRGDNGIDNGFGWYVLGFIEAREDHLRKQSEEEQLFCMGCHTTLGSTIDQTFAFPRKVTGAAGWGYIDIKGMADAPSLGSDRGEILHYLTTVGGGDEFRQNSEMQARWFNDDGSVNEQAIIEADVYTLITPSLRRALDLNKAYMSIVQDQDFIHGRDATITPASNVYNQIDPDTAPVLPTEKLRDWDIRLDW